MTDSGWYECQVNTSPHIGHRIHLSVLGKSGSHPQHNFSVTLDPRCAIVGEKSVYLNVGSSHIINCTVLSPEPPHHIFWYFNHHPLPLTHDRSWNVSTHVGDHVSWSVVSMVSVDMRHSGVYECRPSNSKPDTVSLIILDGK